MSQVAGAGYSYNSQNLRSRKIVGSQATVYHYDLTGNLIAETDANGNLIRDYLWMDATPIAQVEVGEKIAYLHTDHLNTPRLATNPQGQVVWRWEGTAFGETYPNEDVDGNGIKTTINLRFAGQYYDAESGLHYNWHRYYDPKVGRYVTSDPIGLFGGLNTYAYVTNNPLVWMDPWGLDRLINPTPAGLGGPTITLVNDVPGGPSVNLPVSDATADMIENAVIQLGVDININSTSGGIHDPSSRHPRRMACDINKVGGRPVSPSNQDAQRLQEILHGLPNIRENFGPFINTKSLSDTIELRPEQVNQHQTHIHASGQR